MLDALLDSTPEDHPDQEEIPTVRQILSTAVRGSQVGILQHRKRLSDLLAAWNRERGGKDQALECGGASFI